MQNKILLNEILNIENLENVKVRFNLMVDDNWNPIELFKNNDTESLLKGQYWNYNKKNHIRMDKSQLG